MSANKYASFRYRILNDCFRSLAKRYWSLEDLIQHVSEKIIEHFPKEDKQNGDFSISRRQIQYDLDNMKAEKPEGYAACIVDRRVPNTIGNRKSHIKEFYYEDPNFSINDIGLNTDDKHALAAAVNLLSQFVDATHFEDIKAILLRIECFIDSDQKKELIQFEQNDYSGISWIKPLLAAVQQQKTVNLTYRAFTSNVAEQRIIHPYFLKEYRNRWYVFGWDERHDGISNAALDRIEELKFSLRPFRPQAQDFSPIAFFKDTVGVTVLKDMSVEHIVLKVAAETAPYLMTKPLHSSQHIVKSEESFTIFSIKAIINYELRAEIRRFGMAVEVLEPAHFRASLRDEFSLLLNAYAKG